MSRLSKADAYKELAAEAYRRALESAHSDEKLEHIDLALFWLGRALETEFNESDDAPLR